jgi:hypothetical protein
MFHVKRCMYNFFVSPWVHEVVRALEITIFSTPKRLRRHPKGHVDGWVGTLQINADRSPAAV